MRQYLSHIKYTLAHKWYVFQDCRRFGIMRRGIMHDLSKFSLTEFWAYSNNFFEKNGKRRPGRPDDKRIRKAFDTAWKHHQLSNQHHWQWWMVPTDSAFIEFDNAIGHIGTQSAIKRLSHLLVVPCVKVDKHFVHKMSHEAVLEMVADWNGAGKAQGSPDELKWYAAHRDKIVLHPDTRKEVEELLGYKG
jgi:hypothetical protein